MAKTVVKAITRLKLEFNTHLHLQHLRQESDTLDLHPRRLHCRLQWNFTLRHFRLLTPDSVPGVWRAEQ